MSERLKNFKILMMKTSVLILIYASKSFLMISHFFLDWNYYSYYFIPAAEAHCSDCSEPCASTPYPLQPDPAHALLLGLLPLRPGSALLPKLPHTHAGTKA